MSKDKMVSAAKGVLKVVLGLSSKERVLIITDQETAKIADAFHKAAKSLGAGEVATYVLPEEDRPLQNLPDELRRTLDALLEDRDAGDVIFVNAFQGLLDETPFRLKLIRKQKDEISRIGHAPGIDENMMLDGSMTADYKAILEEAIRLMKAFEDVVSVRLTGPAGTKITFRIEGRAFETDVEIKSNHIGNLPAGEIWCAPEETSANGVLMVDGSIGDIGTVSRPLRITVQKGRITEIECGDEVLKTKVEAAVSLDEMSKVIGEFGIGLNPEAKLSGNLLEDEKAGGTAHLAFGNNIDMPGGRNNSKTHRDFLIYKPTVEVRYRTGEKKVLIKDGKLKV